MGIFHAESESVLSFLIRLIVFEITSMLMTPYLYRRFSHDNSTKAHIHWNFQAYGTYVSLYAESESVFGFLIRWIVLEILSFEWWFSTNYYMNHKPELAWLLLFRNMCRLLTLCWCHVMDNYPISVTSRNLHGVVVRCIKTLWRGITI